MEQVWYLVRLYGHVYVRPIAFAMPILAQEFSQSTLFEVREKAGGVKLI